MSPKSSKIFRKKGDKKFGGEYKKDLPLHRFSKERRVDWC